MLGSRTNSPREYRLLVSAGDTSGDLILARILSEIKKQKPELSLTVVGLYGPATEEVVGAPSVVRTSEVAVVGLVEVLKKLPQIFSSLKTLEKLLSKVDSVLCVDFPDFNLKLAQLASENKKAVDYVIAPQVWAWRSGRLPVIAQRVRNLFVALPFEEALFREAGVCAHFLGHPIRDLLPPRNRYEARQKLSLGLEVFCVAILPGSRDGEIKRHFGLSLEAFRDFLNLSQKKDLFPRKEIRAVIALAPGLTEEKLFSVLNSKQKDLWKRLKDQRLLLLHENSREVLMAADFGWICSGTASLEAGLYQLPHILLYRVSSFSVFLLRQMSDYFRDPEASVGLPNILLRRRVIPELLQKDLSASRLARETAELLLNPMRLSQMKKELRFLPKKLGEAGATRRIAEALLKIWGV